MEVGLIYADPAFNCRGEVDQSRLIELADSIKLHGLQCPIMLQSSGKVPLPARYRIISGYRRFYACTQILDWETIPALINTKELDDTEAKFLNLVENINRHDLTQLETAFALKQFIDSGFSIHELAKKIHKTTYWINLQLLILDLDPKVRSLVIAKKTSVEDIKYIASFPSESQEHAFNTLVKHNIERKQNPKKRQIQARPKKSEIEEMLEWAVDYNHKFSANALAWVLGLVDTEDYKRKAQYEPQKNVPGPRDIG